MTQFKRIFNEYTRPESLRISATAGSIVTAAIREAIAIAVTTEINVTLIQHKDKD